MRCLVELSRWKNNFFEVVCCETKTIKVYNFKLHQLQFQSSIVWIGPTGSWYLPPLGGRKFFFSAKSLPLGEGPRMASSSAWLPAKSGTKKHDLKIGPSEFAHFLHAALESIYKNKVLLTFCRKNIFCWPKITFFMPKWPFFHIFQLWELISRSQMPGAVRTWTAILLNVVNRVRGQNLVQIGLKLGEI